MSFKGLDIGETVVPITIDAGPHGKLKGAQIVAPDGHVKCRRFLQVPYAHPPTGEYRWKPPRALPDNVQWEHDGSVWGKITAQPTYLIKNSKGEIFSSKVRNMELSEDALTVNIWTPNGEPPEEGWPVYIYLHGGWLQIGNPAMTDKNNGADLLDEAGVKIVIVAVAYRLSVFGFLASKEIFEENGCGNFGFMDQRLGIEWVSKNISLFGGNPSNITLGGPSAGAYSTQFQLAHEFNFDVKPYIKRVIQYSNAIPTQPKTVQESQAAFDGLLDTFGIPLDIDGAEKMKRLREISAQDLIDKIMDLKIHTFRAVTDNVFIHEETMERIRNGHFAQKFKERRISLLIGEVEKEELLYGATNPPVDLPALSVQLNNYYPPAQVAKIESMYGVPATCDPSNSDELQALHSLYGKMVAGGQVYVPSRSLVKSLFENGVSMDHILRYRVSWRPKGTDMISLFENEVTHSDDTWSWWYSKRYGFTEADAVIAQEWLKPWGAFFYGDVAKTSKMWWGGTAPEVMTKQRALTKNCEIKVIDDDRWERCMGIAAAVSK